MPLVFTLLPVLTTFIYVPEALHLWLVIIAVPVSGYALLAGRGSNERYRVFVLAGSGLALLVGATAVEGALVETISTVGGGLLLAAAHVLNWRRRHGRSGKSASG